MLRPSVRAYAFDQARFEELVAAYRRGELRPEATRLRRPPAPLEAKDTLDPAILGPGDRERAEHAIAGGKVATLVLNGGMATRFGGEPKGVVSLLEGRPDTFLSVKLAQARTLGNRVGGHVPVVLMHSFATAESTAAHLATIDWSGVRPEDRMSFHQSILPRIDLEGVPLAARPDASLLSDTDLYAAPGHGDTLGSLRRSGILDRLRERGVEHVLVSNVDNLGATLDPEILAMHLHAVEKGAAISAEIVERLEGDAGGCVAHVEGRPVIVEAFRLPPGTSLADHRAFNTNTLWFTIDALADPYEPSFFAVRKTIELAKRSCEVVQFEQLIGQVTEALQSAYLRVERARRFVPIKTREDLTAAAELMRRFVDDVAG